MILIFLMLCVSVYSLVAATSQSHIVNFGNTDSFLFLPLSVGYLALFAASTFDSGQRLFSIIVFLVQLSTFRQQCSLKCFFIRLRTTENRLQSGRMELRILRKIGFALLRQDYKSTRLLVPRQPLIVSQSAKPKILLHYYITF